MARSSFQRTAVNPTTPQFAPPIVHDVLRSPGKPLESQTREYMEPRFGHSFENVRVHTGEQASKSAQAVNAHAYAVGNHVVFGEGQYDPHGADGKRVLAHELTHVVQQDCRKGSSSLEVGKTDSMEETEASSNEEAGTLSFVREGHSTHRYLARSWIADQASETWNDAVEGSRIITEAIHSGAERAGDATLDVALSAAERLREHGYSTAADAVVSRGVLAATVVSTAVEVVGQTVAAGPNAVLSLQSGGEQIGTGAGRIATAQDGSDVVLGALEIASGLGEGANAGLTFVPGEAPKRPHKPGASTSGALDNAVTSSHSPALPDSAALPERSPTVESHVVESGPLSVADDASVIDSRSSHVVSEATAESIPRTSSVDSNVPQSVQPDSPHIATDLTSRDTPTAPLTRIDPPAPASSRTSTGAVEAPKTPAQISAPRRQRRSSKKSKRANTEATTPIHAPESVAQIAPTKASTPKRPTRSRKKAKRAKKANESLPDISGNFETKSWKNSKYVYESTSGRLGEPGKVARHRNRSAQRKLSRDSGDHAGHRSGDRFGAPGGPENLSLQNSIANESGTFKKLENYWESKLHQGFEIEHTVIDVTRVGENRPFKRVAQWTETAPNGTVTHHEEIFGNFHTPESRLKQNIPPTVDEPQVDNVRSLDEYRQRKRRTQ